MRREELLITGFFLLVSIYVLNKASSATSLACLILGVGTVLGLGFRGVNPRRVGALVVTGIFAAVLAEPFFSLHNNIIRMLGRDVTLTDRTYVWADLLAFPINPIFGAGFESFWTGQRLEAMWAKWPWHPIQAHSGYIETYINLGWIGVAILGMWMISTFRKVSAAFVRNFDFARFRLAIFLIVVAYSYTEAVFTATSLLWTLFYIISTEYPPRKAAVAAAQARVPSGSAGERVVLSPAPAIGGSFAHHEVRR
jgi:O-antigen ligase